MYCLLSQAAKSLGAGVGLDRLGFCQCLRLVQSAVLQGQRPEQFCLKRQRVDRAESGQGRGWTGQRAAHKQTGDS